MKRIFSALTLIGALAFTAVLGNASHPVKAQDEMMMTHVCDSTLITLLYIAEYDYDFRSMELDAASFEKGQYAPLFEAMMADMMGDDEMMDSTDGEMMEGDMTEGEMMETDMVMLAPAVITGEDEACTALRAELDTFFYHALTEDMMGMEMESEG